MSVQEIQHIIMHLSHKEDETRSKQMTTLQNVPQDILYSQIKYALENTHSTYNAAELAILLLGDSGFDLLIDNLPVASVSLKWHIVGLLGDVYNPKSSPILIDILLNDPEPHIRIQAVLSLGRLGGNEGLAALQSVLDKDFGEDHEGRTVSECAKYTIETYFESE